MFQEKKYSLRFTFLKMLANADGLFQMFYLLPRRSRSRECLCSKMIVPGFFYKKDSALLNIVYTRHVLNEIYFKCLVWCHWPEGKLSS